MKRPSNMSRRCTAVAFAVVLAGCSSLPSFNPLTWWDSDTRPKISELPEFKPSSGIQVLWQVNTGAASDAVLSPAVTAGNVYAAGGGGTVIKSELKDGKPLWRVNVGASLSGGVGSDASTVAVGSPEGEIIAIEANSGIVRWRARVSSEILSAPVVAGDLVLVRSADSRVFALDARDGRRRWVYQRSAGSLSVRSPAGLVVAHGNAYGGFTGGKLVAIALSNGGVRWEATVALPHGSNELDRVTDVIGVPWVGAHEVCAVAYQGRIACFEASNGSSIWGREMSSVTGLSADAGYIFVSDDRGAVHALDRSSGTSVWKQDRLLRRSLTQPMPLGRHVVVADVQGYVHLLSRDSGAFEARVPTDGSPVTAAPISTPGSFLVQTRNGNLFALAVQ